MKAIWGIGLAAVMAGPAMAHDPVLSAMKLCAALDETMVWIRPCAVSQWAQSITLTLHPTAGLSYPDMLALCARMQDEAREKELLFAGTWRMEIKYFGRDRPITDCPLP